ncbi:MAG: hypothetical protein C4524_11570 [Candidatus Zixiibacteriota bacterium]|nr:MAG: hypothetical protein C4524_11570 [candidate division Zixibacteria bacterium]
MRSSRGFFTTLITLLSSAGRIFSGAQAVIGIAQDMGVMGAARRGKVSRKWKEQIYSVDLLLDLDVMVRDKFTRLCAYLVEQGRPQDLKSLHQFLAATVEANPLELTARQFVEHLARLVGDTGTEVDFAEALDFLTCNRIIGLSPDELESEDEEETVILAKPVDAMTDWFTRDLARRKMRRRGSVPPPPNPEGARHG